jgi:two-component system response regulator LytT
VIPYCDIVYIEIQSHYLQLTLYQSTDKPEIRARLRDFAAALPQSLFCQCHRSYIVNLDHIRRFTRDSLTLSNHDTIPVSQTFVSMLKKRYDWYYTGKRTALR